ncbi:hypothetical protein JMJ35_003418 [Cladonia borealis]|uniref:Uncharacterized protein n=1 Tax=Cladonia borealis TaxID=184061 RepID=A0AA39R587_9LECA|nr:hypothetical protein JMJ35_003418 [Cladonia borealis]
MPNWPIWTTDEEIVLVFFLSCGICKAGVRELIAYKCNTTLRDEQDMKHRVFQLHDDSRRDSWNGSGRLLAPKEEAPKSYAAVPDVWTIDWPESWREHKVDDWLIKKTSTSKHLNDLTFIGEAEDKLIHQKQKGDEIEWDYAERRQRALVEKHRRINGNPA